MSHCTSAAIVEAPGDVYDLYQMEIKNRFAILERCEGEERDVPDQSDEKMTGNGRDGKMRSQGRAKKRFVSIGRK